MNVSSISTLINRDNIWPEGKPMSSKPLSREDNTKLRTRMASRISLFALLSGESIRAQGFSYFNLCFQS